MKLSIGFVGHKIHFYKILKTKQIQFNAVKNFLIRFKIMGPNKSVVVNYSKLHHMQKTFDSEKAVGVIWPQWLYGVLPSTNYKVIGYRHCISCLFKLILTKQCVIDLKTNNVDVGWRIYHVCTLAPSYQDVQSARMTRYASCSLNDVPHEPGTPSLTPSLSRLWATVKTALP